VGDEQAALDAQDFDEGTDVVGEGEYVVAAFSVGGAGVAARVGGVDAASGQQVHDVLPAHPAFGESVDAEDGRGIGWAGDGYVEGDTVCFDLSVFDACGHDSLS